MWELQFFNDDEMKLCHCKCFLSILNLYHSHLYVITVKEITMSILDRGGGGGGAKARTPGKKNPGSRPHVLYKENVQ